MKYVQYVLKRRKLVRDVTKAISVKVQTLKPEISRTLRFTKNDDEHYELLILGRGDWALYVYNRTDQGHLNISWNNGRILSVQGMHDKVGIAYVHTVPNQHILSAIDKLLAQLDS